MNKILLGQHADFSIYWDNETARNGHALVTGKSGAGKTTALLHLAKILHKAREYVYVLDYANYFPSNASASEEEILQHPAIWNPFNSHHPSDSNATDVLLCYADMLANIWKIGSCQKPLITRALLDLNTLTDIPMNSHNPFYDYLSVDNGMIRRDLAFLAYCLTAHGTKDYCSLADRFLDLVLLTKSRPTTKPCNCLPINSTPGNFTILRFPTTGPYINAQLTDLFLWHLWNNAAVQSNPSPVTVICDEAKLLNWHKLGIVRKILNEGRHEKINLFLATQSLTDELVNTALSSIRQADLHLAFAPPDTDCSSIAKSIFQKSGKEHINLLANLTPGQCFARGALCSDRTPTFHQAIKINIPQKEVF